MASFTDLPQGWSREEVVRKSGLSAGKTDIYYHGPDGRKYRSKPQIARELGEAYDLSAFDFKSGKMMSGQSSILRKSRGKNKAPHDHSKGSRSESNLTLPVRQTASIFKQPVTVIRNHPESKVRTDLKHGPQDALPPRPLFWERSLTGLTCCDINEEVLKSMDLPSKIQGIGLNLSTENLIQSIAAALHMGNQPVVGQSQSAAKFIKNPTVHINTNQPLVQQVYVTDEDIQQQRGNVTSARKKLEELLAAIEKSNIEQAESEVSYQKEDNSPASSDAGSARKRKSSVSPVPSQSNVKQSKPAQPVPNDSVDPECCEGTEPEQNEMDADLHEAEANDESEVSGVENAPMTPTDVKVETNSCPQVESEELPNQQESPSRIGATESPTSTTLPRNEQDGKPSETKVEPELKPSSTSKQDLNLDKPTQNVTSSASQQPESTSAVDTSSNNSQ